jgi:SAM-dependent methyltransferase
MTLNQNYNSNLPKSLLRTEESEKWYNHNYKEVWLNTNLRPSKNDNGQLEHLIKTLKEKLTFDRIETVLEVGVGYGRVAKAILDTFPNIETYVGTDISDNAWNQCCEYLKDYSNFYAPAPRDFEEAPIPVLYDLVISVDTMSVLPTGYNIQPWIDKMCKLSKKYVVNLDYKMNVYSDILINNPHNYAKCYKDNKDVYALGVFDVPDRPTQEIFIAYIK